MLVAENVYIKLINIHPKLLDMAKDAFLCFGRSS